MYESQARVVADSISHYGDRLTTMVVTFPRIVLAEFNMHRMLSRNTASSRAIPVATMLKNIMRQPFMPRMGMNKPGMQPGDELDGYDLHQAVSYWERARNAAVTNALGLLLGFDLFEQEFGVSAEGTTLSTMRINEWLKRRAKWLSELTANKLPESRDALNVHKQIVNRLLEPFSFTTVIVTATDWSNFFGLRMDEATQIEMRLAAEAMRHAMEAAYNDSTPKAVRAGEWHLPFLTDKDVQLLGDKAPMASAACCARVSYLTHDKAVRDIKADLRLAERLVSGGHMSPFEHVATPFSASRIQLALQISHFFADNYGWDIAKRNPAVAGVINSANYDGNFRGWTQLRKTLPYESDFSSRPSNE